MLRRLESARLAGSQIKDLARAYGIEYHALCIAMKAWRVRNGKNKVLRRKDFDKAAAKFIGNSDYERFNGY
jgi:hypothetical protein